MKRVWTIGVVALAALWAGGTPAMSVPVTETEVPTTGGTRLGARTIVIAGKRVVVEVSARRNFGYFSDPRGLMQTSVYLASADGGSLPGITNVKVSYTRGTARWSPVLAKLPTDVASYRYYVGQNGPTWPVNSIITASVEVRTNAGVARFNVPVKITANRELRPQPGV